jgi:hypothetical protein
MILIQARQLLLRDFVISNCDEICNLVDLLTVRTYALVTRKQDFEIATEASIGTEICSPCVSPNSQLTYFILLAIILAMSDDKPLCVYANHRETPHSIQRFLYSSNSSKLQLLYLILV